MSDIAVNKGGRGSSSAGFSGSGSGFQPGGGRGGTIHELPLAGTTGWYDGNKVSVDSTLNHWEGKNRNIGHEELLIIGDDGFPVAAYKGNAHSVAFDGDKSTGKTVTHIHPSGYGGTFSEADIYNFNAFKQKEIRAAAKEGTYSLKATKTANWDGLNKAYAKAQGSLATKASEASAKVKAQGGSSTAQRKAYVDTYHNWYKSNFKKYGYEYSFTANSSYKMK